jgi:MYXO-CTERM domain-containing protein
VLIRADMTALRSCVPFAASLLVILSGGTAAAQTISVGGQPLPNRIVNGQNLGFTTRPASLSPLGVNAQDCLQDMTLQFTVTLAGFTGSDTVQVWGSTGSDCTAPTDRGIGVTHALCWGLRSGNLVDPITSTPQTYTFNVRVQDLVGWQQTPPDIASASVPPPKGKEACSAQPTFAAVPMTINFLAVDSSGNSDGTPYQYAIITDLVGPPAPAGLGVTTSGSDLLASWTPNTDKDTVGYDLFFSTTAAPDGQAACAAPSLTSPLGAGGVGSFPIGAAQSDTEAAVVAAAVDGMGNVGPATSPACDAVGTVDPTDTGDAHGPGVSCSVAAPGGPGRAAPLLGLLGIAWAIARRSRRRAG